jgi:hypothetical protein
VWYQENNVDFKVCSDVDGEDPTCADSLPLPISGSDHTDYLNVDMSMRC